MEPYQSGIAKGRPICRKRDVVVQLVVVLATRREGRRLRLIAPYTRALPLHAIHEFVVTDESEARPEAVVDSVAYLGFAEVVEAGVTMVGDTVTVGDQVIGVVAGFDEAHMPNHFNIVIQVAERRSGFELGLTIGSRLVISSNGIDADSGFFSH